MIAAGAPSRSRRGLLSMALVVPLVIVAGFAEAHHAWNEIDTTKTLTLTGTVKSLKWENPHASLVLETVDGATTIDWTVMMSGIARMQGHGVPRETVEVGKSLTIVGSPARDEPHVVRANRIRGDGGEHVLY